MKEKASRKSSQREATEQTVAEIEAWWIKAWFLCQSSDGRTAKLLKLVNKQKQYIVTRFRKIPEEKEKNYTSNSKKAEIIYAKIKGNILGCK